jgi:hypothetical protein
MENTHANVVASALSGLRRLATGMGAGVVALLRLSDAQIEITWFFGRSQEQPLDRVTLQSSGVSEAASQLAVIGANAGATSLAAGSPLATFLKHAISEQSQSFLLVPSAGSRKMATGVIGFAAANPPISDTPDAVVENLNLLEWATWSASEITRLRSELRTLNERLAGRKLVERAKSTLQAERSINEEQAYEYLRALSRRRRITIATLSAEILRGRARSDLAQLLRSGIPE